MDGQFAHNRETVEGSARHKKVDSGKGNLKPAEELTGEDSIHSRSVMLSSDRYGLIAKMDLIDVSEGLVTPVDYKRGAPRTEYGSGELTLWDADKVQLAAQVLVLRDNGYRCEEGVVYYVATKQRVRLVVDEEVTSWALEMLRRARLLQSSGRIPPPLVDSPKCPRCSLVGICLPDETVSLRIHPVGERKVQKTLFDLEEIEPGGSTSRAAGESTAGSPSLSVAPTGGPELGGVAAGGVAERGEVRRLVPARDDQRPLYLNTQGLRVGKSGYVLKVQEKDKVIQEVRINDVCQLNLMGNVQLTTQAIQALCEQEVPIAYFSMGGWFYGVTHGLGVKNIYLRREQFRLADVPHFCLRLARSLVSGKIRNQRTLLQRNHVEPPSGALAMMKAMQGEAEEAESLETLLGVEGYAARVYFEHFGGMIKLDDGLGGEEESLEKREFTFDFRLRNRRPPRDPVNALLSLAYSLLAKDLTIVCHTVGFDPYLGFYHQPRHGRAALPLDLMEPFRPLIAESAVLTAINTRMVTSRDFVRAGESVALTAGGRKSFFRAYEQRMDSLVTHPIFGYRVNYRRVLEIQARLLARVLTGELVTYPVFVTR